MTHLGYGGYPMMIPVFAGYYPPGQSLPMGEYSDGLPREGTEGNLEE